MTSTIRPIALFLVLAFGLAWLVTLPLWLGQGISSPLFTLVAVAMMLTPAIAAIVVVLKTEPRGARVQALGLRLVGSKRRLLGFLALALVIPIALIGIALVVGSLLGVYTADLVGFSGFQAFIDAQLAVAGLDPLPMPIGTFVAIQCVAIIGAAVINTIPALGEELGWRGWLFPKMLRLGTVPAIVLSGVIWGLWHAPVILLGHNYPEAPGWLAMLTMVGMCTVIGAIFGWLRLRSGSVWPAALAHGSFNAAAGMGLLFSSADAPFDPTVATILGWTGWIVPAAFVAVLVANRQFVQSKRPSAGAEGLT